MTHGLEGRCSIQLSYGREQLTAQDLSSVVDSVGTPSISPASSSPRMISIHRFHLRERRLHSFRCRVNLTLTNDDRRVAGDLHDCIRIRTGFAKSVSIVWRSAWRTKSGSSKPRSLVSSPSMRPDRTFGTGAGVRSWFFVDPQAAVSGGPNRLKEDAAPLEAGCLVWTHPGIQDENHQVGKRVRARLQVDLLLFVVQNELAMVLSGKQLDPEQPMEHAPFVGQAQHTAEHGELAVDRGYGDAAVARLDVRLDQPLVDRCEPGSRQRLEFQQACGLFFVLGDRSRLLLVACFDEVRRHGCADSRQQTNPGHHQNDTDQPPHRRLWGDVSVSASSSSRWPTSRRSRPCEG